MIEETLKRLKRAEFSLLDLLDISRRKGPGMLSDLSEWIANESISSQVGGIQDYQDSKGELRDAWRKATKAKFIIKGWVNRTKKQNLDWSLANTSYFIQNHLEDCVDLIQQAIQILEEAQNNE